MLERTSSLLIATAIVCHASTSPLTSYMKLLCGLFSGELALPAYEAIQPCYAGISSGGAVRVYVPVEGLAVVTETAV